MDPFAMFTFLVITLPVEIRLLMAIADSLNLPRLGKLIVVPFGLAMIIIFYSQVLLGSNSNARTLQDTIHPKKSELELAMSRMDELADLYENLRQEVIHIEEVFSRFPHLEAAGKFLQQNKLDLQETHSRIVCLEILKARLKHKPVPGSVS